MDTVTQSITHVVTQLHKKCTTYCDIVIHCVQHTDIVTHTVTQCVTENNMCYTHCDTKYNVH